VHYWSRTCTGTTTHPCSDKTVFRSNIFSISAMLSIADCPTSGFAPAPSPSVKFTQLNFMGTELLCLESVLQTIKSSFNSLFKHVVYSVTSASTYTNYFDYIWFFGKSNEILPNSELLIILFGFNIILIVVFSIGPMPYSALSKKSLILST
jgi:hypothetical protein